MKKKKYDVGGRKWNTTPPPLSPDKAPQNMLEVVRYEHKGVVVHVKIDYLNRNISLVNDTDWTTKKWVFAQRGLEYMQGWKNILDAMRLAVEFAETKLRMRKDEKQAKFEEQMLEVFDPIQELRNCLDIKS